jgi:acetyl esterase
LPPMCLLHGTADDIVPYDSIKDFTDKMHKAGNRCELNPFEGTDHFFINNPNGSRVLEIIDEFLMSLGCIDISSIKEAPC